MEKHQPIEINPVEENNMIEVKTVKPQKTQNLNSEKSGLDENNSLYESTEGKENQDIQNDDELYEEIIFQDDFNKEYRDGTEDNYFEE